VKYLRLRPGSPHWTLLGMLRDCREDDDSLFRNDPIVIRFYQYASVDIGGSLFLLLPFVGTTSDDNNHNCCFSFPMLAPIPLPFTCPSLSAVCIFGF
jgi:hypothetical protein